MHGRPERGDEGLGRVLLSQDSQERERVLRGEVESERRGRSMLEERISCMRGQLEEYKEAGECC